MIETNFHGIGWTQFSTKIKAKHSAYLSKLLLKTQNRDKNIFMLSLAIAILKIFTELI